MGLKERLLGRIAAGGSLPFEGFMTACLYDPDFGYFATGPLRSEKAGDFLTSPEVSPLFGEALARYVAAEQARLGDPSGFAVVEIGAGSGSLLRPLLAALPDGVEAYAVDVSPAARERLGDVVAPARVVASLGDLPGRLTGVVIANEVADNLPCALAVRTGAGWEERWVGATAGELELVAAPARPEVAAWADAYAGRVPDGGLVEVQLAAADWLREAGALVTAGSLLVIDYGGTAEELEPRRTQGTLRTYRAHHIGPDPLTEPGATDVTADVNFTALVGVAREAGWQTELSRQDDFLAGLGLRDRLTELRHRELDLARSGDALERLQVRSRRTDAETLLHPRGLGDFRVLTVQVG